MKLTGKQILVSTLAPFILFATWVFLYFLLDLGQPWKGFVCNAMCIHGSLSWLYDNCCTNGLIQKTIGVWMAPYTSYFGLIKESILILEVLLIILLFRRSNRVPLKRR